MKTWPFWIYEAVRVKDCETKSQAIKCKTKIVIITLKKDGSAINHVEVAINV